MVQGTVLGFSESLRPVSFPLFVFLPSIGFICHVNDT